MTSCTGSARMEDFGDFEKVSVWVESCLGRRQLTFAFSWRPWAGVTCVGSRWKSKNRKNVYLSPYVEEPFYYLWVSKVIKSFVPELRSRKCFSCSDIPMFYVYIYIYIWTFYVHFTYPYMGMVQLYEFEPQSRYDVHFRINTFGKGVNPLTPSTMG